jgi:hypothetical protein
MADEAVIQTTLTSNVPAENTGGAKGPDPAVLQEQVNRLEQALTQEKGKSAQAQRYVAAMVAKFEELAAQQPKQDPTELADSFLEAFKENPQAALDAHWNARMNPVLSEHLTTQSVIMRKEARQEIVEKYGKKAWDKYAESVDAFMEGMSPSTKAKPGAWIEAYRYVVAANLDNEVEEQVKDRLEREIGSQLEGVTGASKMSYEKGAPLTPIEKNLAKEFGMSQEEWRKNKESYSKWEDMK